MPKSRIVEPPFVMVQWLDAWGEETTNVTLANAHEAHKGVPMETIGWVIRHDDKGISVCCERCTENADYVYRGRTFIPAGMIVEVVPFKLTKARPKPKPTEGA